MKVGISTACFFPMETERVLQLLLESGERNIEIFINSFSELKPRFLREIKSMVDLNGGNIVAIHPFSSNLEDLLFSPYLRRREDMLEFYKGYFDFAAEIGAFYVVLHGPGKMFHVEKSFYAEQLDLLDRAAQRFGVRVLQENVARCMSRDLALLAYLHQQLPDFGFTLDLKQAARCGFSAEQMLQALGDAVKHIHFSDRSETQECLWPGRGTMDIPRFVGELCELSYDGCLMIEVYECESDMCGALLDCAEALRCVVKQKETQKEAR